MKSFAWASLPTRINRCGPFAAAPRLRATVAAPHKDGTEAAGLISAYGQNFVPDTDSPLLDEMAREYAEFANEIGLAWLAYDGYEIHAPLTNWGPRSSDRVARLLDHPVVSDSSSGTPVDSNIEYKLNRIRKINQFGYHTVNLSLQLDSHRPASSVLDAWYELSADVAKGYRQLIPGIEHRGGRAVTVELERKVDRMVAELG